MSLIFYNHQTKPRNARTQCLECLERANCYLISRSTSFRRQAYTPERRAFNTHKRWASEGNLKYRFLFAVLKFRKLKSVFPHKGHPDEEGATPQIRPRGESAGCPAIHALHSLYYLYYMFSQLEKLAFKHCYSASLPARVNAAERKISTSMTRTDTSQTEWLLRPRTMLLYQRDCKTTPQFNEMTYRKKHDDKDIRSVYTKNASGESCVTEYDVTRSGTCTENPEKKSMVPQLRFHPLLSYYLL